MSATRSHDHDWALGRLSAFAVGLLAEEDTLRLEQHLAECDACRVRLAAVRPAPGTDPAHLPASLIATWRRSARLLGDAERKLVGAHLDSCEACRASLVFTGQEPVLPPRAIDGPIRVMRPSPRIWARGWALGFSTVAAAAAVWLLVVQPRLLPRDARTSATMRPLASAGVRIEGAVPSSTAGALALPEPGAGSADIAPVTEIGLVGAEAGVVLLLPASLSTPDVVDGAGEVTVALYRDGRELGALRGELASLGGALRIRPERSLPSGDYELRLTIAASGIGTQEQARLQILTFPLRVR